MTDKELLEAAAKAVNGGAWHPLTHDTPNGVWNPLNDDGDGARLESELLMHVEWHPATETVYVGTAEIGYTLLWGKDRQASRRHAAVRAAAAIGGRHD